MTRNGQIRRGRQLLAGLLLLGAVGAGPLLAGMHDAATSQFSQTPVIAQASGGAAGSPEPAINDGSAFGDNGPFS